MLYTPNFKPARLDPTRFLKSVTEPDPTRSGTLSDGSGRVGLQYSTVYVFIKKLKGKQ